MYAGKWIKIVAILFMIISTTSAWPALATDFNVGGSSSCTLADAIKAANQDQPVGGCAAGSGSDTIVLGSDITLTKELPSIRSQITINGQNNALSGGNAFLIFNVKSGARLTLLNLVLENGNAIGKRGGAVRLVGGEAQLEYVTLRNNTASKGGGALRVHNGTLTCRGCELYDNSSTHGGAIWVGKRGTLGLRDSRLFANRADYGGAIFNQGDSVTLNHTVVASGNRGPNTANQGGGIFSKSGVLTLESDSDVVGNRADTYGGGILVVEGRLIIRGSNENFIGNNSGQYGGGIYLRQSTASITGATFEGNSASSLGPDLMAEASQVDIAPTVSISADGQYYRNS